MDNIQEIKKKRFKVLKYLYDKSGGTEYRYLVREKMYSDLMTDVEPMARDEVTKSFEYLQKEGLVTYPTVGTVGITHYGIKEIEAALSNPEDETDYFPPINIINIENMQNSLIQQGTSNSTQTGTYTINENNIKEFLIDLQDKLPELELDESDSVEIKSDIDTIEIQLSSGKPKSTIIRESLSSIKRILEGVASSMIAQGLLVALEKLL